MDDRLNRKIEVHGVVPAKVKKGGRGLIKWSELRFSPERW